MPHLYDAPVVNFFEYFYRAGRGAFSFRPEMQVTEPDVLCSGTNNSMILLDLQNCDRGWCPNFAQRNAIPKEYHAKIDVIPEGVDTDLYHRRTPAERRLPDGTAIPDGTRIVTYVARGFELMRGFDVFMDAARRVCERLPNVLFVVVGTDKPYYLSDGMLTGGKTLRRRILESGGFDLSRFRFTGWLSEDKLIDVLSLSDLHVYLTAPFITSWSMLDAMSCSCVVLASDQGCTHEYITDGRNGLLCDFFDADAMAARIVEVLKDPEAYRVLGDAARITIEEEYSLDVSLPRIKAMFEDVVSKGPRAPTARAEALVRDGKRAYWMTSDAGDVGPEVGVELPPFDGRIPFRAVAAPCQPEGPDEPHAGPARDERSFAALRMTGSAAPMAQMTEGAAPVGPVAAGNGGGKTVLIAWELGMGLGHLMQLLPLARDLAARGYTVVVALRHLERAAEVFGSAGVFFLQAPYRSPGPKRSGRVIGFAQLLANLGFGDDNELFALASAWRNLIRSVGPDLILCDYSPTALLAARDFPEVPRAVIGSGFCVPPDVANEPHDAAGAGANGNGNPRLSLWAALRRAASAQELARALAVEAAALQRVNWVLEAWGRPPMERLGRLFADVNETFLTTFPELDHFRDRRGAAYWGPVLAPATGDGAEAPRWPDAAGKRVFVYLKPTPAATEVLAALRSLGCPTVAFVDGAGAAARKALESPTVHLAERRLDIARAAAECDVAVLNGGHGVVCEMLLAGKPVLAVPLVLEQQMTGEALRRLGAGESAPPRRGEPWEWTGRAKLEAVLNDGSCAEGARRFADRYAKFDRAAQREAMLGRAAGLLEAGTADTAPVLAASA